MKFEPSHGSSNIVGVGWEDGVMGVKFMNGGTYWYTVSKEVFENFKAAGFRGGYFHRNIRSVFTGTRRRPTGQ